MEAEDEKIAELLSLQQVVGTLEPRDKKIILFRYFKNQTQTQTAQFLGMTQVQVSRREKVILNKLQYQVERYIATKISAYSRDFFFCKQLYFMEKMLKISLSTLKVMYSVSLLCNAQNCLLFMMAKHLAAR